MLALLTLCWVLGESFPYTVASLPLSHFLELSIQCCFLFPTESSGRWDCLLFHWNKPPFHCTRNLASLSPDLGRDSSTYVQAVACLIHSVLYCSSHENASHRPLPTGNSTGLEPQLQCSKIHHHVYSKAILLGLLPVDDQGNRDTKANPILEGKGLYQHFWFQASPKCSVESLDHVTVEGASIKLSFPQSITNLAFPGSLPFFCHRWFSNISLSLCILSYSLLLRGPELTHSSTIFPPPVDVQPPV